MQKFVKYMKEADLFWECLVLKYAFSELSNTFTWIGVPSVRVEAYTCTRGERLFVKIVFQDCDSFKHDFPSRKINKFLSCHSIYDSVMYSDAIESEYSVLHKNCIKIFLPYLFGNIQFSYKNADIECKRGRGEKSGDDWVYYDVDTDKPFAFENPFNE